MFAVACFVYLVFIANIADSRGSDAAGRGLGVAFNLLLVIVLWPLLVALLATGPRQGSMPSWVALPAFALVPLSAVASLVAAEHYVSDGGWWILVPGALPPLIALYALWARFHPFHNASGEWSARIAWGAILIVTLAPLAMSFVDSLPDPAREAQERMRLEQRKQEEEAFHRREAGRFESLGPHSSLRDYLEYLPRGTCDISRHWKARAA